METIFYDEEAENSVLGSMMENNRVIPGCLSILGENSFMRVPNQLIYDAICELTQKGDVVDAVTVASWLESKGELNRIGGPIYLYDIVNSVPASENAEYYARIVRGKRILRQLANAGKQIASLAISLNGNSPTELLAKAQQMLLAIDAAKKEQKTIVEQTDSAYQLWMNYSSDRIIDIATGFKDFDILSGGFGHEELIIIGGYPSAGKSTWAYNVLHHIAVEQRMPCVLLSYEDKVENIINRMVSMVTGLNPKWRDDRLQAKSPAILDVFKKIQQSQLIINDQPPLDISEVVLEIQKAKLEKDIAVVVVDNIQLIFDKSAHNSEQTVSHITASLKNVAKLTNVAVVAISHLSREAVKTGRRPVLSDLRYSGMAEGNADKVIFVHREDYGEYEFDSPISPAEIILAKNRNGNIGSIPMSFHRGISRFEEA